MVPPFSWGISSLPRSCGTPLLEAWRLKLDLSREAANCSILVSADFRYSTMVEADSSSGSEDQLQSRMPTRDCVDVAERWTVVETGKQ